jgi:fructoselysine and glucoselysine-specific PTS system IIA component
MEKIKRKFLIASHGTFSAGTKSSLDIIVGAMENVFLIQAYTDENVSVESEIRQILTHVSDDEELVIFCDILGGSVTNQMLQHALKPGVHIISGFNLPLVIEVLLADTRIPIEQTINDAINNGREQMVYVNTLVTAPNQQTAND